MKELIEKFNNNIKHENYCWIWTAGLDTEKKPRFFTGGSPRVITATRWAWINISKQKIDDKSLLINVECNNNLCVNPDHYQSMTRLDYRRGLREDPKDRFNRNYKIDSETGCWNWTSYFRSAGYGAFNMNGKTLTAHRVSYSFYVGKLIDGMVIDHLCSNRACVNPEHLEQVTNDENMRRAGLSRRTAGGDECPKGHLWADNEVKKNNTRACRSCDNDRNKRRTFVDGVYVSRSKQVTDEERFMSKVLKDDSGCWNWQATIHRGYGAFSVKGKTMRAHRWAYEFFKKEIIPEGLVIDHLCENKSCVNPEHLEAVTISENSRRWHSNNKKVI